MLTTSSVIIELKMEDTNTRLITGFRTRIHLAITFCSMESINFFSVAVMAVWVCRYLLLKKTNYIAYIIYFLLMLVYVQKWVIAFNTKKSNC